AGNAEERGDRDKRAQVVDVVERRIELLDQQDRPTREPAREAEPEREEARAARRGRLAGRNGRVENPELLDLLSLLEARGELCFLVSFQQGLVTFLGRRGIARQGCELFLPPGNVFDALLITGDGLPKGCLL